MRIVKKFSDLLDGLSCWAMEHIRIVVTVIGLSSLLLTWAIVIVLLWAVFFILSHL